MKMRIISSVVVLGLGIAGMALAQQQGERPKAKAGGKAKLRAQMVALRAELELLQVDHEAARVLLLDATKDMRKLEEASPDQRKQMAELSLFFNHQDIDAREQVRDEAFQKKLAGSPPDEMQKVLEEAQRERDERRKRDIEEVINNSMAVAKARLDLKRKTFVKQAVELAEKKLDLEEVEKQYREAD